MPRLSHTVRLVIHTGLASRLESTVSFPCADEAAAIAKAKDLMANGWWYSNRYMTQVVLPHSFERVEIYPALTTLPH